MNHSSACTCAYVKTLVASYVHLIMHVGGCTPQIIFHGQAYYSGKGRAVPHRLIMEKGFQRRIRKKKKRTTERLEKVRRGTTFSSEQHQ